MSRMDDQKYFDLYLETRSRQVKQMDRHSTQFEHYLTLITAILAVTFGLATQLIISGVETPVPWVGVFAVFSVNSCLGYIGTKSCDRSYQRFLEEASIAAKLERYFGLSSERPRPADPKGELAPFREDKRLVPDRWWDGVKEYETSEAFKLDKMSKGVNKHVRSVLWLLSAVNGVLAVWAVMMGVGGAWSIVVSEPGSILLVGGGLAGLAGYATLRWKSRD